MPKGIDSLVSLLKWPIAVVSLICLPGLALALFSVVGAIYHAPRPSYPFLAAAAAYAVLWVVVLRGPKFMAFANLEHELTHALFAWLSLHRVVGLGAALRSGGHARYVGKGNWLIAIAPFFVPTFSLILVGVVSQLPVRHLAVGSVALGVTLAYHVLSTWPASHRHQSDLREVGFLFRLIFLPAANLLVYGLILSAACGLRPLLAYLRHVPAPTVAFFHWVLTLF
jgi:hypothetical protein